MAKTTSIKKAAVKVVKAAAKKVVKKAVKKGTEVAKKAIKKVAPATAKTTKTVKDIGVKKKTTALKSSKVASAKLPVNKKKTLTKKKEEPKKDIKKVKSKVNAIMPPKKAKIEEKKIEKPKKEETKVKAVELKKQPEVKAPETKAPVAAQPVVKENRSLEGRKTRYNKAELENFRKIILEKRDEIIEQLQNLREQMMDPTTGEYINENSPYSLHMAEQGTDAMEREKTFLYAQRENKFLGYLEDALNRIEQGTYGLCIECIDEPQFLCDTCPLVPKARLEAVPHSQLCLPIKQKQEKHK